MTRTSSVALFAVFVAGCPSTVDSQSQAAAPAASAREYEVDESDPRVVRSGDDLYPADSPHVQQDQPPRAKGSGKPDESNGYCRLYAPKLPEPHCCKADYGFDANVVAQACGLGVYMGESFQTSCGYFFLDPSTGAQVWFRTSFVQEQTPKQAALAQAKRLNARLGKTDIKATELKGVPGAWTLRTSGLAYAWFSGKESWPNVRRLAWKQPTCGEQGIAKVVSAMSDARAPGPNEPRVGLVPQAR